MMIDVVYPVRPGECNDELRFSLRSLRNVPHSRVWIVGHKPSWVTGVGYIDGGNSQPHPRANLYHNLWLACTHAGVTDEVLIFNDDFFVTEPVVQVPILYRGSFDDQVAQLIRRAGRRGWWQESMLATQTVLRAAGYDAPLSYELHVPFRVNRAAMAETLVRFSAVTPRNPPQWRTLYGNMHRIGGALGQDCKELRPGPLHTPFHSTDDLSWRHFRAQFRRLLPEPSPYEVPTPDARSLVNVAPRKQSRRDRA